VKSISALINARLESTRVPRKLTRPFAGSSLLEIALEKLNRMDFVSHRYLAVAEAPLIDLVKGYPQVKLLKRDETAVKKGVNPQHVTFAHYLKVPSDYILVFNPCLPMLTIETVRQAYEYVQRTDYPSYTSAIKTGDWVFDSEGNPVTNSNPQNLTTNKDVTFYKAAHAFHFVDRRFFETHGYHWTFTKDDPHLIKIPESEAVDVDTEVEFEVAEGIYKQRFERSPPGS
jgi:CMP-N-acetylneuraminic acid synthetase